MSYAGNVAHPRSLKGPLGKALKRKRGWFSQSNLPTPGYIYVVRDPFTDPVTE